VPAYRESGGLPDNGRIARPWDVSVRSPVATGATVVGAGTLPGPGATTLGDQHRADHQRPGPGGGLDRMAAEPAAQPLKGLDQAERHKSSQCATAFGQGIAQARAHLAVEQVASCIEGALPAAVPGRQGVEDRLAAVSRQVDAADGQEIVDAQLGPGPRELRGHRPGCRPELRRERRGVGPFHLVGDQGGAVPIRQARQPNGDRPCLFLLQRPLVGPVRLAEIDQAVQVALLGVPAPNMRDGDIAGQDHRERCQGVVVEPWPGLEEPGEGLLDEIVDDLWIPDTGGHHTSDQGRERKDVPLLGV
jgi:hypothetical protein